MDHAVRLLAARARGIEELRERLLKKNSATPEIVEQVLNKLKEYGYLDDERYARGYASSQVRRKPVGRHRLERALELRKIDRETAGAAIESVFEEIPEEELIERAIARRVRLRGEPKSQDEKRRLLDHLLRRGFPYDMVASKVRALSNPTDDDGSTNSER